MPWYWINLDREAGFTEAWNSVRYASDSFVLGRLFRGPERADIRLDMMEWWGSERGGITLRIHGPIEDTGERWQDDFEGLPSSLSELRVAGFKDEILASFTNEMPDTVPFTAVVSRVHTYTYGVKTTYSGSAGVELQALKLNVGSDVDLSTSNAYQSGVQYIFLLLVPPGRTAVLAVRPMGTAVFPICSKWKADGYDKDSKEMDVRPGHLNYRAYLVALPGGGGGASH